MEDNKLMSINIINMLNKITYKRREGFALVLALVVVSVGLIIVTFMFSSVSNFASNFADYRRVYVDTITARGYIEQVKGEIVAVNNRRNEVVHGLQNQDANFDTTIDSLEG
jgi:multidrug resistance efflux pump